MYFLNSNKEKIILILALLIVGVLKFIFFANFISPPFDAYEYLLSAKNIWKSHTPLIDSGANYSFLTHEPGYPFLIALFYPLFYDFEKSAAFVTVMASILSIFFVYLLMERIEKNAGKFAAFLLATSSLHLHLSDGIRRDMPSLCLVCFILYKFYNKQFSNVKIIFLGILIGFAFYIHMINIFLIFLFLFFIFKEKRFKGVLLFLGSFLIVIAPYLYLSTYKWPVNIGVPGMVASYKNIAFNFLPQYTLFFFKSLLSRLMHWEPLIIISSMLGIYLILKKDTANQLLNLFWKIYFVSCLSLIYFICIGAGSFGRQVGDSYLLPFLVPFILIGSISFKKLFEYRKLSRKSFFIIWIIALLSAGYMAKLHMAINKKIVERIMPDIGHLNWIFILFLGLFILWVIFSLRKRLFLKAIIVGTIFFAFSIQIFDEVGIKIRGLYKMKNRGKEISFEINALKNKIFPMDAYLIGLYGAMAIRYHTDYPLPYDIFARLVGGGSNINMDRIMKWGEEKPVIFVYDHVYRWYLRSLEKDVYIAIQDKYPEKLIFSNLKLNLKIYLLDNMSSPSYYRDLYNNAILYFKDELRKDSDNLNLLNYLGWTYYCSGDSDQAIETWQKKLMLTPEDADNHNNLGLAYAKQGEYQEAIIEYKNALKFKPLKDPHRIRWAKAMIYFNLAQAFEKINDIGNAVTTWRVFYNTIPYPENQEIMERNIKRLTGE